MVEDAVAAELPGRELSDVEDYVTGLLFQFLRTDRVFAIQDHFGRRLTSVYEMLGEADVLINADSFDRERQVHKHIGDYILFWTGVNPDFLRRLKLDDGRDLVCDYTRQGKESYHVVSTFDYKPYDSEAPTFRRLSEEFEGFVGALSHLRDRLPFHAA
jgi:hypothetical protein